MIAAIVKKPVTAGLASLALILAVSGFLTVDVVGLWNQMVAYGITMQRDLHRDLAAAMRAVQQSESTALWTLVSLGFFYGVFHAIGPGHGKVVISTYLATHESRLGRGIALSLLSSLVQGLSAVVLVGSVALVLDRTMRESQQLGVGLEILSYGLVVLIGLFLTWRGARRLLAMPGQGAGASEHPCCGHKHGPTADDLEAPLSVRQLAAMILSIGIRPCSGAILVLALAIAMQQLLAGMAAVLAMSLGTGLAISALAVFTVYARKGALTLAGTLDRERIWLTRLFHGAAVAGGLLITVFGVALLQASLAVSRHPLL